MHRAWHEDKGVRYLRVWVSGKTGTAVVDRQALVHAPPPDIAGMSFETVIAGKLSLKAFRLKDGTQPYEFTHVVLNGRAV